MWVYEAEPGEVDEEHQHEFDTKLVILRGEIQVTQPIHGVVTNMLCKQGGEIFTPRNIPHTAKVGPEGCRYIVAEKN